MKELPTMLEDINIDVFKLSHNDVESFEKKRFELIKKRDLDEIAQVDTDPQVYADEFYNHFLHIVLEAFKRRR